VDVVVPVDVAELVLEDDDVVGAGPGAGASPRAMASRPAGVDEGVYEAVQSGTEIGETLIATL
jgi:hypothetical protein